MPKPSQLPLSLSDCLCPICREILLEPVTLPCSHTLCTPCFQMTVEKASLSCPMCRRRVATWARLHARSKTLVDLELWERIQREFPVECQRRANGQDSDLEEMCMSYPAPLVSKPGELRQEYEQEVSKVEAERRAREEEEIKASEALIQRLLAEEEAETVLMELRRREQEEQLRRDEQLAQMLSGDLASSGESSCRSPERGTPVPSPARVASSKSCRETKKQSKHTGDIQRFLSPVHNGSSSSFLSSEVQNESTKQESVNRDVTINGSVEEAKDDVDEMPVLSQEATYSLAGVTSLDSDLHRNMPELSPKIGVSVPIELSPLQRLAGDSIRKPGKNDPYLARLSIDRCTATEQSTQSSLDIKEASKRKDCESSHKRHGGLCLGRKRQRILSESDISESEDITVNLAGSFLSQRLVDVENNMYERWHQEEQDRLFALQIQRELDKELSQVNRQKGSPDGYLLRRRESSSAAECKADVSQGESIHSVKQPKKKPTPTQDGQSKPRCGSPDENKKPCSESRPASPANVIVRRKCRIPSKSPLLDEGKILQSSNKQPTILEMFHRSAAK
ncbi:E3 ubiquitin-protein ligase RNF168 [Lissotriton helveticus]